MKVSIVFCRQISQFLVMLVIMFSFHSCGKKQLEPLKIDPAFAAHVISFTSGVVSNTTRIQVRLVQEIPNASPGKQLDFNPFSLSPGIKGVARWVDRQTIEFVPEQHLPAGEIYTVDFELGKFISVPKELQTLTFRFQVMSQSIRHEFEGISPCRIMDKRWQQVHNIIYTADYAEPSLLEKSVEVTGSQPDYKLKWEHSKDGRTHILMIDSVRRNEQPVQLRIDWDGDLIGADKSGKAEIEIPGLDEFTVMQVKTVTAPKAAVDLYFSDPLSKTQDLTGLIALTPGADERVVVDGNKARIVPGNALIGNVKVSVYSGVENVYGASMGKDYVKIVRFVELKPQVELIGEGVIVPGTDGILFPFRAVSLNGVDVKIIRIFENNMVQFLQSNQLDGNQEVKRVGRVVYSGEVVLTASEPVDYTLWNVFALDLSKLIKPEPGAIYRVEISFRRKHSLYPAAGNSWSDNNYTGSQDPNEAYNEPNEYWGYYEDDVYNNPDYNWDEKDDPNKPSYYIDASHRVARNVLASNLGIIAKAGSNLEYHVAVTDLLTTDLMEDVEIEFRNLQNQLITTAKTNSDGFCTVKLNDKPFVLIAKKEKQRGYLRLDDASSLSLSMFDVKGEELKKGVKGYLYGERGVWRPGDIMYLTFVLEDKNNALPFNHPVVLELYNPSGQLAQRVVKTVHLNGFYTFQLKTPGDAPTGNWSAKVLVGSSVFARNLRIETVKPNRMKINLIFPSNILHKGVTENGKLQVNWLHGAPARNAKVTVDATLAPAKTEFPAFPGYVFDDPTKSFVPQDITVFKGALDAGGATTVQAKFNIAANSPGMVAVQMKTMAYDAGGEFSIDRAVFKYSPYKAYAGVRIPVGKGWNGALYSDEDNVIPIALVDENGRPLSGTVKVEIFSVYWRWWWDLSAEENLADYVSNQHTNLIKSDVVTVRNGKALYVMNTGVESWGRKLIRITDQNGGHSTAAVFYTTGKGWWSNAGSENPGGAEMLMFQTNKKEYKVGEEVSVELPVSHKGRALISIETGSKVLRTFWFSPSRDNAKFTFEVTPDMSPNAYIHITYIQPHNHGRNDFPIRMYGVQAIQVEDPSTHLTPVIRMKNELKPLEKFTIQVKESKGKAMTYTIAIVDDGLLDLTRFKTPNPWNSFYAHEALGVRTWDLYKYVSGAFTGKLSGLYAIGGDEYLNKKGKENNNRFKPVVLFQGPYSVRAGETKSHSFTMPNYVGSVRVMVVAGQNSAYGTAEKTVPVRQSLMVLSTLPRVVSPSEVIKVPVTVFSMDKGARNVQVKMAVDNHFIVLDGESRQVTFEQPGDKLVEFKLKVKDHIAQGKIVVTVSSGAIRSSSETNLKIRMPNPPVTSIIAGVVGPGKTWTQAIFAVGITGTNFGSVEVSSFYPIDLSKRLDYLIQYPHGCIEQITSAAFPQIYLNQVMELSEARKRTIEANVKATLTKIKSYQLSGGGFSYWPGESSGACDWGTNYAGHFLLEAQALGYTLPVGLLEPWVSYQTTEANNWQPKARQSGADFIQAYRLYTLALAKRPVLSAMNRMRETPGLSVNARWRLAAAYAVAGKPDIASGIVNGIGALPRNTDNYADTYGSFERDQAMMLETMVLLKQQVKARALVQDLSGLLSSDQWLSTHSTASALMAISKYIGRAPGGSALNCEITLDGKKSVVHSAKAISQTAINYQTGLGKQLIVTNNSSQNLYVRVAQQGIPAMKLAEAKQSNLKLTVNYFDMKGKAVNPVKLKQGTQFYAEVAVIHPGARLNYNDLAINQIFPSGWEIINSRMDEVKSARLNTDVPRYQDIRDDRVYTYFGLDRGQKKVFRVLLQAAYPGVFYLPSVQCEAMYDNTVYARTRGQWVEVVK